MGTPMQCGSDTCSPCIAPALTTFASTFALFLATEAAGPGKTFATTSCSLRLLMFGFRIAHARTTAFPDSSRTASI